MGLWRSSDGTPNTRHGPGASGRGGRKAQRWKRRRCRREREANGGSPHQAADAQPGRAQTEEVQEKGAQQQQHSGRGSRTPRLGLRLRLGRLVIQLFVTIILIFLILVLLLLALRLQLLFFLVLLLLRIVLLIFLILIFLRGQRQRGRRRTEERYAPSSLSFAPPSLWPLE